MSHETRFPVYFVSHGGGPWPYMKEYEQTYAVMRKGLEDIPKSLKQEPKAILVVSAHWEEEVPTLLSHPNPPMYYDYGGFPDYTYRVQYPAKNSKAVYQRTQDLLQHQGFSVGFDGERGFDHGTFVPLCVIYPEAAIPVVQVSIMRNLDSLRHIQMGQALAPLRDEGILILTSGFSFHNLRLFARNGKEPSHQFDKWLQHTLNLPSKERVKQLIDWEKAPSARLAHPREEHLIPLMVAVGAAQEDSCQRIYHEQDFFGNLAASSYRFG